MFNNTFLKEGLIIILWTYYFFLFLFSRMAILSTCGILCVYFEKFSFIYSSLSSSVRLRFFSLKAARQDTVASRPSHSSFVNLTSKSILYSSSRSKREYFHSSNHSTGKLLIIWVASSFAPAFLSCLSLALFLIIFRDFFTIFTPDVNPESMTIRCPPGFRILLISLITSSVSNQCHARMTVTRSYVSAFRPVSSAYFCLNFMRGSSPTNSLPVSTSFSVGSTASTIAPRLLSILLRSPGPAPRSATLLPLMTTPLFSSPSNRLSGISSLYFKYSFATLPKSTVFIPNTPFNEIYASDS